MFPGSDEALNGTNWTATQLEARTHFINCHGAIYNPGFYGQKSTEFPLAMRSDILADKITHGTIVAAECCYGGQLFDPKKNSGKRISMANSYLLNHALAFVGSSNIAYGPPTGQGLADLLTQYFVINVLNGASTGRALLEARQRFLNEMGPALDPYELKTARAILFARRSFLATSHQRQGSQLHRRFAAVCEYLAKSPRQPGSQGKNAGRLYCRSAAVRWYSCHRPRAA